MLRVFLVASGCRVPGRTVSGCTYARSMSAESLGELAGQTSINELLNEPIGTVPVQLALPIPNCPRPG